MRKLEFGVEVFLCTIFVALCFSSCLKDGGGGEVINGANLSINDPLPALDLTLSDGSKINDGTLTNKVSLIFFFSTTCPDCMQQFPIAEQLYKEMKEEKDFVFCAISRSQGENTVSKYWKNENLTMPYSAQNDSHVYGLFASRTIPRIYISDRNNIIKKMYDDDPIADYESMMSTIKELLSK